jgi:hypothetical protein
MLLTAAAAAVAVEANTLAVPLRLCWLVLLRPLGADLAAFDLPFVLATLPLLLLPTPTALLTALR